MAKEYNKNNIVNTYYSIIILDACNDIYEEIFEDEFNMPFTNIKQCVYKILNMRKHDKELGKEFGT